MNAVRCKKCSSPMVVRNGPTGHFLGCYDFPDCKYTRPMNGPRKDDLGHYVRKLAKNLKNIKTFTDCFENKNMSRCVGLAQDNLEQIIMELISILASAREQ